jgi:hypothetical protein
MFLLPQYNLTEFYTVCRSALHENVYELLLPYYRSREAVKLLRFLLSL